MNAAWERLVNEAILDIHRYQPGKPIEELERELGIPGAAALAALGDEAHVQRSVESVVESLRTVLGTGAACS